MGSNFYKLAVFFACVFPDLSSSFAWDIPKVKQKKAVGEPCDRLSQKIMRNCPRYDLSLEEFVRFVIRLDTGEQYRPSWHGKKNIRYKSRLDYRTEHSWERATKEFNME